jgi:hypothetical protein
MANEKKPSIYYDRSTIGSQDELDEYGVWVKSEPQDLSSAGAASAPEGPDFDLAGPDMDGLPDMDMDLDSLDFSPASDGKADDISLDSFENGDSDTELELPEFDDDISGSFDAPVEEVADSSFTDISMDDFPGPQGENSSGLTEELTEEAEDLNLDIDFNELEDNPAESSAGEDVEFDDIAAVDRELRSASPVPKAQGADLSTQLLMKIADELSSIKAELSSLKSELAAHTSAEVPGPKKAAKDDATGFFDEEEDEKIALTGDELNNILNTADFTEEAGQDATGGETGELDLGGELPAEDVTSDFLNTQEDALQEDVLPEDVLLEENILSEDSGETEHQGLALRDDEIPPDMNFPETAEEEIVLDDSLLDEKDNEVLKELRKSGAQPITPAPEDTSYLEEVEDDLSLEDPLFSEGLDDAPDEGEPDLEGIGIDLDLEEPLVEETSLLPGEPELPEEELELDLGRDFEEEPFPLESAEEQPENDSFAEDSFASVLPEGFVVDADEAQLAPLSEEEDETDLFSGELPSIEEDMELAGDLEAEAFPDDAETVLDDVEAFPDDVEAFPDDVETVPDEAAVEPDFSAFPEGDLPAEDETLLPEGGLPENIPLESASPAEGETLPPNLQMELKTVLSYMDQLLESLPEEKIEEFAKSEYYETYKKLFEELGLV